MAACWKIQWKSTIYIYIHINNWFSQLHPATNLPVVRTFPSSPWLISYIQQLEDFFYEVLVSWQSAQPITNKSQTYFQVKPDFPVSYATCQTGTYPYHALPHHHQITCLQRVHSPCHRAYGSRPRWLAWTIGHWCHTRRAPHPLRRPSWW